MTMLLLLSPSRELSEECNGLTGSTRSHLPLPGPIRLNCLLSHFNPPQRWETDWRQATARILPLPHHHCPQTLHHPKYWTSPDLNVRPTSCRYRDFYLCVIRHINCLVFGVGLNLFFFCFFLFVSTCLKRCWSHYGNTTLHGPSKLLLMPSNSICLWVTFTCAAIGKVYRPKSTVNIKIDAMLI